MGDFTTRHGNDVIILTNDVDVVLGTAMLGDQFGTIKRAVIKRVGDREMVRHMKTKKLLAVLIHNPGFEMSLECAFGKNVTPPGMGESLSLPLVGVTGHVMEGVTVQWEAGSERGILIPVSAWDEMQGATAQRHTLIGERVTLGPAGLTAPSTAPVLSSSVTSSSITVAWGTVARASQYEVQMSSDGGSTWSTLTTTAGLNHTHGGLSPSTARKYRVRASNFAGNGPWSDVLTATTAGVAPSTAPTLTAVALNSEYSIQLTWTTSILYVTDFELQVSSDGGSSWAALSETSNAFFAHQIGSANVTRKYRVRGRNSVGNGPWSTVVTSTTKSLQAPTLNVSVVPNALQLNWGTLDLATSYELQSSSNGGSTWTTILSGSGNTHQDGSMSAGDTRHYRVRASNAVETGPWSSVVSGTLVNLAAPVLTVAPVSREAKLRFSFAPVLNASSYEIQFSPNEDFSTPLAGAAYSVTPTLVDGLIQDNTFSGTIGNRIFYVRARAVNAAGNGPWSDTQQATTPLAAPEAASWTTWNANWNAVTGADGYLLYVGNSLVYSGTATTYDLSDYQSDLWVGSPTRVKVVARRNIDGSESPVTDLGQPPP